MRRKLPAERRSIVHEFRIGEEHGSVIVGFFDDGTPGEVFINVSQSGSLVSGLFDAVAVLTSTALQHGIELDALVQKFTYTRFAPAGMTGNPELPMCTSILDYVFRWLDLRYGKKEPHHEQPSMQDDPEIAQENHD